MNNLKINFIINSINYYQNNAFNDTNILVDSKLPDRFFDAFNHMYDTAMNNALFDTHKSKLIEFKIEAMDLITAIEDNLV